MVEEFGDAEWTQESDVKKCVFSQVKVNGESQCFIFQQPFSTSSLVPLARAIGHTPSSSELESVAKARIRDSVSAGKLDGWPPSAPVLLGSVSYTEADVWVQKAGL